MTNQFLSPIDAARITGMQPAYIYLLLRSGRIKAVKVEGFWRLDRKAFEKQFAHRLPERKFATAMEAAPDVA